MSALLEALRLHQPLPKLASPRPVFNRAENIITACTDHATVNGHTSYPALAELYENAIRSLCAQLEAKSTEAVPLTDERIDFIADTIIKGMPDGARGFCASWGYRQFARALLDDCAHHYRATSKVAGSAA